VFIPGVKEIAIVTSIIVGIAIVIYLLGIAIYKHTSQLDALQRD
jgi:hypothetical protein